MKSKPVSLTQEEILGIALSVRDSDMLINATLHGGFLDGVLGRFALAVYVSPLEEKKLSEDVLSMRSQLAQNALLGLLSGFWNAFFPDKRVIRYPVGFRLPSFQAYCPVPGPRALNAIRRAHANPTTVRKHLRSPLQKLQWLPTGFSSLVLPISGARFQNWLNLLNALEDTVPGFLTPALSVNLSFLRELQEELFSTREQHGEVLVSGLEVESLLNGRSLTVHATSGMATTFKSFCNKLQELEPAPGSRVTLWPALPFGRAFALVRRFEGQLSSPFECIRYSEEGDEELSSFSCSVYNFLALVHAFSAAQVMAWPVDSSELATRCALAYQARSRHGTLLDLLQLVESGRPAEPGGAVYAVPKADDMVCTPAVPRPDIALSGARKRNCEAQSIHLTWREFTRSRSTAPTAFVVNGVLVPYAGFGILVDFIRIVECFSSIFSCPTFLRHGEISLPAEDFDTAFPRTEPQDIDASDYLDVALAINQHIVAPALLSEAYLRSRAKESSWFRPSGERLRLLPFGVHIATATTTIRQGIRYELQKEGHLRKTLARAFSADAAGEDVGDSLWKEIANGLQFVPVVWFEIDGEEVSPEDWLKARPMAGDRMLLPGGQVVDANAYSRENERFLLRQKAIHRLRLTSVAGLWAAHREVTRDAGMSLSPEEYLKDLELRLTPFLQEAVAEISRLSQVHLARTLPAALWNTMRPYQRQGAAWLHSQTCLGLGVCLADEMGLGKTLQAIAFLHLLRGARPALVVAPKSVLPNWLRELSRFAPDLRVTSCAEAGELVRVPDDVDVCVTTYPRLRLDSESIAEREWSLVCLDEAHLIKNGATQLSRAVRSLRAGHRIALTGTPVENHASDLWNLVDWLTPEFLGSERDFVGYTSYARSSQEKLQMLQPIHGALAPVMLRRRKSDPEVDLCLPEKVIENRACELTDEQEVLYRAILAACLGTESMSMLQQQAVYLKAIQGLKQVCIHPDVFLRHSESENWFEDLDEYIDLPVSTLQKMKALISKTEASVRERRQHQSLADSLAAASGKLQVLRDLLDEIRTSAQGIVIFTQYKRSAELLQRFLAAIEPSWSNLPFLHGGLGSAERQALIDSFQEKCLDFTPNGESVAPVLIASLKAGGVGLNLMQANVVIHLDRWWNPAVEDQATDRVHRIGQAHTVLVFTLSAAGTIEAGIDEIMAEKRALAADLLGAAGGVAPADVLRTRESFLGLVDPTRRFAEI